MKGHNLNEMGDAMDVYIRRGIKNWAAQNQAPDNGRARLLLVAASPDFQRTNAERSKSLLRDIFEHSQQPEDRSIDLYDINWLWAMHMSFAHIRHVA